MTAGADVGDVLTASRQRQAYPEQAAVRSLGTRAAPSGSMDRWWMPGVGDDELSSTGSVTTYTIGARLARVELVEQRIGTLDHLGRAEAIECVGQDLGLSAAHRRGGPHTVGR